MLNSKQLLNYDLERIIEFISLAHSIKHTSVVLFVACFVGLFYELHLLFTVF